MVILLNVSSGVILKEDSDFRSHFKWLVYVRTQSLQSAHRWSMLLARVVATSGTGSRLEAPARSVLYFIWILYSKTGLLSVGFQYLLITHISNMPFFLGHKNWQIILWSSHDTVELKYVVWGKNIRTYQCHFQLLLLYTFCLCPTNQIQTARV